MSGVKWFDRVTMTPERWLCYEMMERADEGLGPRAYRTLLQIGDGDARLLPNDVEWMTDGVEKPPLASMHDGRPVLTSHGVRRIAVDVRATEDLV